jgi:GDP-mannose transporter
MANHIHRRNLSNDGVLGVESAGGGGANGTMSVPPRANSSASKGDVESPSYLPPRGRSRNNDTSATAGASNGTPPTVTATKQNGVVLTGAGWKAVSACINYSFCSVSMILVNKSLASRYVFPSVEEHDVWYERMESHTVLLLISILSYNNLIPGDLNILLVVFQAIVAVVCVETFKHIKWIEHYPSLTWEVARSWAPVNLFFCAMLFTGMASLQTNSVPMVTVFKNITNIITTAGDYFFFGNKPDLLVIAAFGIMLFGALAAAWNDMSISSVGLFWMGANCVATAGYVLYMKFATVNVKLTKFGMVYVNNVLCVVFLLPAAMMKNEIVTYLNTTAIHTPDYFFKNVFAGFVGFFLNYASLSCVQAAGPTTYAIVGSLNKIPVAFLGYILFDNVISYDTCCYIAVSMFGGFLYSYAQIKMPRPHTK